MDSTADTETRMEIPEGEFDLERILGRFACLDFLRLEFRVRRRCPPVLGYRKPIGQKKHSAHLCKR